jgi:ubiquinol-cytochrome c reductase cytochrome c1 subunit
MKLVPFRALQGIGFTADQVQQIAADWPYQVDGDPDDEGKVVKRPLRPADRIIGPFANDQAARFHMGGVVPPDLSVIVKARQGGEDYIANLLVGYRDPPPDGFTLIDGRSYNTYFPGHQIAMPPLLQDDTDNAADGSKTTALQKAQDVAVFLSFVADPTQDERKALGFRVILFLLVVTGLLYLCKRAVWHNVR